MLNRWIETTACWTRWRRSALGCIAFSPLAQGMLTGKYLDGIPAGSRAQQDKSLSTDLLTDEALAHIRALNEIAQQRGQSLAQLALAWALRDRRVTSVLIGASSVEQLDQNLGRAGQPGLHRRRARRDRPARGRRGHRPLAGSPHGLTDRGPGSTTGGGK